MKKIIIPTLLLLSLCLVSASSIGTVKQNESFYISNYCQSADCSFMNLTSITYPNKTTVSLNYEMNEIDGNKFIYQISFVELGEFEFCTLSNPLGAYNTECDTFEVTPSGQSGTENMIFFIVVLALLYFLTIFFFFKRDIELAPFVALSGMALGFLGLYMIKNGVIIYRDVLTNYISYVTMGIGFGLGLWSLIEWIQDSL